MNLVEQGKRVGITATSHKVIRNLLDEVAKVASQSRVAPRLAHKIGETEDERHVGGAVAEVEGNEEARQLLEDGVANVLGGTAWLPYLSSPAPRIARASRISRPRMNHRARPSTLSPSTP